MIRRLLVCFALLPTWAGAADFTVRSGEHDGFSRLVVYLDAPRDWTLEPTETGYELQVAGTASGFATADVFEFIPKRRLSDLRSVPGTLRLDVSCACPVRAFAYQPDILVLDIFSDAPDAAEIPDSMIIAPFEAAPKGANVVRETPPEPVTQAPPLRDDTGGLPSWLDRPARPLQAGRVLGFSGPVAQNDILVDRDALVAGIADAATHGLVTLSDPEDRSASALPEAIAGLRQVNRQISVKDTLLRSTLRDAQAPGTEYCLPPDRFAVHEWGDPEIPASVLLGELRAARSGSDMSSDPVEAAARAVRSYIFLGFGSEAAELLRTFKMPEQEARVYAGLAGIVDFPGTADPNPFADQRLCRSPGALWAFVATRRVPARSEDVNTDAILRHFAQLPPWLRVQLGDTAVANFEALGDAVSAEAIRASIDRGTTAAEKEAEDHLPPQPEDGAPVAAEEGPPHSDRGYRIAQATEALARHADEGTGPSADERAEITALILETRGSSESVALFESFVWTVRTAEDILAAEHLLKVLSRSRHAQAYPLRRSWTQVLRASAAQESHEVFLGVLTRNRRAFERQPPDRAAADAAVTRLLDIGLPQSARDFAGVLDASPRFLAVAETAPPVPAAAQPGPSGAAPAVAPEATGNPRAAALRELLAQPPADDAAVPATPADATSAPLEVLTASEAATDLLAEILSGAN